MRLRRPALALGTILVAASPARADPFADLTTSQTVAPESDPGTDVPFRVTVTNLGPDAADSIDLLDFLPQGMTFVSLAQDSGPAFACTDPGIGNGGSIDCTAAGLAAGASASFTFVF